MKKQPMILETEKNDKIDKRDLVNIDLYYNEIKVMGRQLEEAATRQRNSSAGHENFEQLKRELTAQKENLERFKERCTIIPNTSGTPRSSKVIEMQGFFDQLKAFEARFKSTRNKVNDVVN